MRVMPVWSHYHRCCWRISDSYTGGGGGSPSPTPKCLHSSLLVCDTSRASAACDTSKQNLVRPDINRPDPPQDFLWLSRHVNKTTHRRLSDIVASCHKLSSSAQRHLATNSAKNVERNRNIETVNIQLSSCDFYQLIGLAGEGILEDVWKGENGFPIIPLLITCYS